jgi:chromosome segregation protein
VRLKRLEMVGFKSFAEKTRVEFEAGITAVVGPNGCGKSNISDSVRWALGEMSAKSLRSSQMMDVIFNGTAKRPAQGMSEVNLTFDNTDRQIPLDFTEVTITRRLFRSGESEYFINKTQCRLKDLKDLFLDTGIGNDGYYVMAQGKIEFILSAKPEERRELFEEAAGVAKYKARREEALRRLAKVDQDMLRLNDSLAIYKQQMDTLDAAVRKAKTHQKLQEDVRTLEIATLAHGQLKSKTEWEQANARFTTLDGQVTALREELTLKETTLTESRTTWESMEQTLLDLQRQVSQLESDYAKAETERRTAQERETEIRQSQERLGAEDQQLNLDLSQWRQTQTQLASELENIRGEYSVKNDKFKEEDVKARTEQDSVSTLQRDLEKMKSRIMELARLISHHRSETGRLTSLSVRHDEASKAKVRELEKVQVRRAAFDEQIHQQEEQAGQTQAQYTALTAEVAALDEQQRLDQETLVSLEGQIQEARERLARLETEKVALERWLSQDPIAVASDALQQAALPGIHGPIGELFKAAQPYQRLLQRALGERREYFIADSLNDAQNAVRYLSENHHGWASFLVLGRISQDADLLARSETAGVRSLSESVECEERFRPVLQYLLGRTFYVGETLFEEGLIRGGADPSKESFQATPGDLARLNEELSALRQSLAANEAQRSVLRETVAARTEQRRPLVAEQNRVQVQCQVQQESLSRLREDRGLTQTEEKLLEQERDIALKSIEEAQEALKQEEALLTTLEGEEKSMQESLQTQDVSLQERRHALQSLQTTVSQLRVDSETLRERLVGKERDDANARERVALMETRQTQIALERTENEQRLTLLVDLQAERGRQLEVLEVSRAESHAALQAKLTERQDAQTRLHEQEQVLSQLRETLTDSLSKAQAADFESRTLEQERVRYETTLRETFQMSVEDAWTTHGEIIPDPEELARRKRRLENMGAVNLAAPEEYEQLTERYQFLQTQQQDLLKAKQDLMEAITKINVTTLEQFKVTFEQVRTNFRNLYQTLFQGGEADLVLTDEKNLLDSGIDIMAQPPGKKLQSINLLSGGEKALTATALLFAFFMVKPSPFCMLDEVDAPLDEANVQRFLRMVKTFSEKTQFIMMTHNKRSMEMADVIYGVTMAELGVSTLMSVKMESSQPKEVVAA